MADEPNEGSLANLLPSQWFDEGKPRIVRVRAYQMARAVRGSFQEHFPYFATARFMALLGYGPVQYVAAPDVNFSVLAPDEMQFAFDKSGLHKTMPDTAHVLVVAPEADSEDDTRFHLDVAAGLVGATLGANAVFRLLYENLVNLTANQISVTSAVIRNPLAVPAPNLTRAGLSLLANGLEALAGLSDSERARVRLALHWHEQAIRAPASDQFLKQWIALEALGMDLRNNVRPLNALLAAAYRISVEEARDRFGIGRIFGFRSRIVHRGERLAIHGVLQAHVEAIFRDILFEKLKLAPQHFAAAIELEPSFDLKSLLHER